MSGDRSEHPVQEETPDNVSATAVMSGESAGVPADEIGSPTGSPDRIGRYRILGRLGEGGMGVVYEAQQEDPRRKVAVKVIRGGQVADERMLRMFKREIDSLARLQHRSIGGIFESGVTPDGQHFFAMELVPGPTLDSYLTARGAATSGEELRFRLSLFRRIADAVHYAHQRGVIHRDLKPSNIVVTEDGPRDPSQSGATAAAGGPSPPEIKILDFGLARITEGEVATRSTATEVGAIRGTLAYMSPEQTLGRPDEIDLRTDVYALGVILYEMLSGRRPHDLHEASMVEAIHLICEAPPTPLRQAMRWTLRVDPDVETIVGKALEKHPDHRYQSAEALSQDIARYLALQPILARPPTTLYQLRMFAARNKALVGGAAATLIALLAGVIVATTFGIREASERRQAERAQRDLEAVAEFQARMLSEVNPEEVGRRLTSDLRERVCELRLGRGASDAEVEAAGAALDAALEGVNPTSVALGLIDREILDRAAETIDERFADQPLIDARLRDTIGETYSALGLLQAAEPQLLRAWRLRRELLSEEHPQTLESMRHVVDLYSLQGRQAEAEELAGRVLEISTRVLGSEHPDALAAANALALVYAKMGRLAEVEQLYLRTLAIQQRVLGEEHPDTMTTMNNLGSLLRDQGRFEEAERQLRTTLELRRRVHGPNDRRTISTINNLAITSVRLGRTSEAEALFRESLAADRRVLGEEHPETLSMMNNLALVLTELKRYDEAEAMFLETLALRRKVLGASHPDTLVTMNNLGNLYWRQGRVAEVERLDREALAVRRRVLGDDHPDTLVSLNNLAVLLRDQGRFQEAEPLFLEALEKRERLSGFAHPNTNQVRTNLINMYLAEGRSAELRQLVEARRAAVTLLADRGDATAPELNDTAWLLLTVEPPELRDPALALRFARIACDKEAAANGPELWNYQDTLALAHHTLGDHEAAVEAESRALSLLGDDRPEREGLLRQLELYQAARLGSASGPGAK